MNRDLHNVLHVTIFQNNIAHKYSDEYHNVIIVDEAVWH